MNARAHFIDRIQQLCNCEDAPLETQEQVLAALRELASTIELTEDECRPVPEGYAARLLHSDAACWSLALIVQAGILSTPAVAIDGTLLVSGRIPRTEEVQQWLAQPGEEK